MTRAPQRTARLIVAAVVVGIASLGSVSSAGAQWWKERAENRLDQRVVDATGQTAARLKWDDGYIEVRADAGADPAIALNRAHARGLAVDAARQLAYFKLAEIVEGVAIDGVTVVKNAIVDDQTVRSSVRATIQGARVVSENVTDSADGVWAAVVMGLRLRGSGSLSESIAGYATSRPADVYRSDQRFGVNDVYTGVVVDASDVKFSPAVAPRLLEEASNKPIFGAHVVEPAAFARQGAVGYALSLGEARRNARVGTNPLIVRAIGVAGPNNADLVLSKRDAERVAAADRTGRFLKNAGVVVVRGADRGEWTTPRARHALVVGIDDYPQAGGGAPTALSFAARDARTVAAVLAQDSGAGAVTLVENGAATRTRVLESLRALRDRVRDEDTVVFFFSGHGSVGTGKDGRAHYYLVPHDGRLSDLAATGLEDNELEELIGQLPARQVVVILDACYSGGAATVVRRRGVTNAAITGSPLARSLIEASAGRVVISASRPDQPAFEDDQRGGIFTSFLLEGLGGLADVNNDGAVDVLELYQFLAPRVRDYTRQNYQQDQAPVLEVRNLSDPIVLARRR
jgi:hypothetical protein